MNILFLCRLYYPHIGGVEKHVREVSLRVTERCHKVKVITEKYEESLKDFEIIDGVEVYRIKSIDKWQTWLEIWRLKQLLDWADIIHAHDVYYWIMPYKLSNWQKKTYITFHGWEGKHPVPFKNILVRKISELMANGNICVGDYIPKYYFTKPDVTTYGATQPLSIL